MLAIVAMTASGCAYHRELYDPMEAKGLPTQGAARICVVPAQDGIYQGDAYEGSGGEVSSRTRNALSTLFPRTTLAAAQGREGRNECSASGADYLLTPTIQHWEDRATQWSGLRDLIRVQVDLERLQPGPPTVIRTGRFEARNGWFTLMNRPPEELLADDDAYFWFVRGLVGIPRETKK